MSLGWQVLIIVIGGIVAVTTYVVIDGGSRLERMQRYEREIRLQRERER